jgi:ComF family protein
MIDKLLKIIAPHHCKNCNQIGGSLCEHCKYDIINTEFEECLSCMMPSSGLCQECKRSYSRAWCVSELKNPIKELLYDLKFDNNRAAAKDIADLLHGRVDFLPNDTIVTHLPTLPSHIRRRGYDQSALIAKHFAKKRKLKFKNTLYRSTKTHQRDSTAKQRWTQAKNAFGVSKVEAGRTYFLIDDVVTTGASIEYAAKCLIENGAKEVWVGAIARQTLD